MAIKSETTAASVHANSYSIIAAVGGFLLAIVIIAVLLFIFYDGRDNIAVSSAMQTNAVETGDPALVLMRANEVGLWALKHRNPS